MRVARPAIRSSCRPQQESDTYGVEWKLDLTTFCPTQESCIDKGVRVAVHSLHVAPHTPCRFPQRHGALAGHGLQEFPALGCQHTPEQLGRREADSCSALGL